MKPQLACQEGDRRCMNTAKVWAIRQTVTGGVSYRAFCGVHGRLLRATWPILTEDAEADRWAAVAK